MAAASTPGIYVQGDLFKRSRGLHPSRMPKTKRIQKRFCTLTGDSFIYFKKRNEPKGDFPVKRIMIVEELTYSFKKGVFWFQFGDNDEIIYLAAETESERCTWIEALRKAAADCHNEMLSHYHPEPYTGGKWNCCKQESQHCQGCQPKDATHDSVEGWHLRQTPELSFTSTSLQDTVSQVQRRSSTSHGLLTSYSQQSGSTSGSESEEEEDEGFGRVQPQENENTLELPCDNNPKRREGIDSGFVSALSSRSSSEAVDPDKLHKKVSVKQTRSLNYPLDEGVADLHGSSVRQGTGLSASQPNLPPHRSYKPEPGHKQTSLQVQQALIVSKLSKVQTSLETVSEGDVPSYWKQKSEEGLPENPNEFLLNASQKGLKDDVELAIKKFGADVNYKHETGTTALSEACKNGHTDVAEFLIMNGADVNEKGTDGRTPLHEAAEALLHTVELLLKELEKAETVDRTRIDATSYDLAYNKGHSEVMAQLRESMPESVRPNAPLNSVTLQPMTVLTAGTDTLISGSPDGHVHFWDISGFKPLQTVSVSGSVLAIDVWNHYIAIGSNVIQMLDMSSRELKRIKFFEENESIPTSTLPSHFVAFAGNGGHLATARAQSTVVNIWPPPSPDSMIITSLESSIPVTGHIQSLSASHNSQNPWLAVVMEEGKEPHDMKKSVYLISWKIQNIHERLNIGDCGSQVSIHIAFSPDGRNISVGCGNVVSVWKTLQRTGEPIFKFDSGATISSMVYSNSGRQLSAGLCTGEVDVFESDSGRLFTLGKPSTHSEEALSSVTTMTYSQDDSFFAIGHQNGVLQMWKVCSSASASTEVQQQTPEEKCTEKELLQSESLLIRTQQLNISNKGFKYHSKDDDFTLTVPEGAVPTGDSISIQVGVVPYGPVGPFKYPDGVRPVSPIVWLCSTPKFEFQKPLELSLPHCIDCSDEVDCRSLTFLKADHTANQGSKVFHFEKTDGKASFAPNTSYGTLSTTHFCLYCVVEYTREDTDKANYCLVVARPLRMEKISKVYFCLTYFLKTCLKLVDEQFEEHYDLIRKVVRFDEGPDRALEIKIERNDSEANGWQIALSQKKITAKEVCFWDAFATVKELVLACELGMYPPRSILDIYGENSRSASRLEVEFDGAASHLSTEILLSLATTTEGFTQTDELPMVDSSKETVPVIQGTLVHGTSVNYPVHQVGSNLLPFEESQKEEISGLQEISSLQGTLVAGADIPDSDVLPFMSIAPEQETGSSGGEQVENYSNGPQTHADHHSSEAASYSEGSLQGVGVIDQTSILYNGIAQHFSWKNYGFKLELPSNALPPGIAECPIKIKAIGEGHFRFPDDSEPVSGIYSISSPCTLQKEAVVEIQHCAVSKTIEQCSRLSFVVARSTSSQDVLHNFSAEGGGVFSPNSTYGCIRITQFSLWSMVCNLLPGLTVQRVYSAALYYIHDGINSWKVHFVITWDLDVHIKSLSDHFGKNADVLQQVEFDTEGIISLAISEDSINSRGWTITPLTRPVVRKEQVDRYTHGRRIPSCQILVEWADNERRAVKSVHRVTLKGTKEPDSFFQIECKPITRNPVTNKTISVLKKEPQLHQLENEIVSKIPKKWEAVGIQLGLPANKLDQISTEENNDCQKCFRRVFIEWKSQNCERNWSVLLRILQTDAVGEVRFATELSERLLNNGE